jgi:DUF4097 and DUF4098 domain-containing protein YvlB
MRMFVVLVVGMFVVAVGCGATPESPASAGAEAPPSNESGDHTWFEVGGLEGIFAPGDAARISVVNPFGDIIVVSGANETVSATARLRAMGEDEAEARSRTEGMQLRGSLKDDELALTVEGGNDLTFVALRVTMPPSRDLALDASAGKASVEGIEANVSIAGMAGDITVTGVRGPLRVHTETGNVTVRGVAEGTTVYTTSGKVELSEVEGPVVARTMTGGIRLATASNDITANTRSGDIDLQVNRPLDGTLEARTDGGNIEVRLPATSSCRVTTMTRSGDIASELPLEDVRRNGPNIAGRLGGGKGTLLATTNSGNVLLLPVE